MILALDAQSLLPVLPEFNLFQPPWLPELKIWQFTPPS